MPADSGSPKKSIIPSPMYLSMVAPYLSAIFVIVSRYRFNKSVTSSDSIFSTKSVKPQRSEKKTVSFLRLLTRAAVSWEPEKIEL